MAWRNVGVSVVALLFVPTTGWSQPGVDVLLKHEDTVLSLAWSPDGKFIVTGGADKMVRIWDVANGKEVRSLAGHGGGVASVLVSPDGKRVITGDGDSRQVNTWDFASGQVIWKLQVGDGKARLAMSPDGRMIVVGRDKGASVFDAPSGKEMLRLMGHKDDVNAVATSPDGKLLLTASKDKSAGLWEMATGKQLRQFSLDAEPTSTAFSPDGKQIALGGTDKVVRVFDAARGEQMHTLKDPTGAVRSVVFSPDGTMLAACSEDRMIRIWDTRTGKLLRQAKRHTGAVTAIAFSPDGKSIASAGDDKTVMISTIEKLQDFKLEPIDLTQKQLDDLWSDLCGKDATKSSQAVFTLAAGAKHSLPFLKEKIQPAEATIDEKMTFKLIRQLDDDSFEVRERATKQLIELGKNTGWILRNALTTGPSTEVKTRLTQILDKVGNDSQPTPEQARDARIIEVLEYAGSNEAKILLAKYAGGAEEAQATQLAKKAIARLKK